MTTKTIAITGATGQFGAIALDFLKAKNANVIALVRSPEKISDVEARKFDYSKTEGQVEALKGVDTLILVSSSEVGQRIQQHKNVIEAAKKAYCHEFIIAFENGYNTSAGDDGAKLSRISIGAFRNRARAIIIRCR